MGSALVIGEWRAVLAVALAALSFLRKLRLEERRMHQAFGEAIEHTVSMSLRLFLSSCSRASV